MFGSAVWAHPLTDVERFHVGLPVPAARAQLARWKRAADTDHRPPVPFRFILEHVEQSPPRGIGNAFGQLAILLHVPHAQVLHAHHLVFADEAGGQFVQEIVPTVGDFLMKLSNFSTSFVPIRSTCLSSRQNPLPVRQLLFISAQILGNAQFSRLLKERPHASTPNPRPLACLLLAMGEFPFPRGWRQNTSPLDFDEWW